VGYQSLSGGESECCSLYYILNFVGIYPYPHSVLCVLVNVSMCQLAYSTHLKQLHCWAEKSHLSGFEIKTSQIFSSIAHHYIVPTNYSKLLIIWCWSNFSHNYILMALNLYNHIATSLHKETLIKVPLHFSDSFKLSLLCGLAVRVHGYWSRGLDSIPSAARFSEK
jgi:hypothetical protein